MMSRQTNEQLETVIRVCVRRMVRARQAIMFGGISREAVDKMIQEETIRTIRRYESMPEGQFYLAGAFDELLDSSEVARASKTNL